MHTAQLTGDITTTGRNRNTRASGTVVFLGALWVLVVAASPGIAGADEASADCDDGWRRTKDGWEHIATWPVSQSDLQVADHLPLAPALSSPATENFPQLHPGLLAAGMCLLAGLALRMPRASSGT